MKHILLVAAVTFTAFSCAPTLAEVNIGIALGIPGVLIGVPGVVAAPPPVYYVPDDDNGYVAAPPSAVLVPAPPVVYGPNWWVRRYRGDHYRKYDRDWKERHWHRHDEGDDDD